MRKFTDFYTADTIFQCNLCSEAYSSKSAILDHLTQKHKVEISEEEEE